MTDILFSNINNLMTRRYTIKKIIQIINNNNLFNQRDYESNDTILHIAVRHKNIKVIKHLLTCVDLNRNVLDMNYGESPLHIACRKGYIFIVKLLINKSKSDIEFRNIEGQRPIVIAYLNGNYPIVRFLYENGADSKSQKIPASFMNLLKTKQNNEIMNNCENEIKRNNEINHHYDIIKKVIANEKEMINKEKSKFNLHVILYKQEEASSRKKLELYKDKIDKEKTQLLIDKHKLRYEENLFFQKLKDSPVPAHFIQEYEELLIHNNSECKICYEKYEKKTDEEEGRYIRVINNCFHKCCNICVNEILKKEKQECPFCRENIISII